ncbi:NAD(P)-binding protein, partial [Acinetobacter baumannii]
MPAILFTAYAGFPMLNAKQHAIQKTKIAIIGAGFGGLAMAIRLLQSQQSDFFILEKSNDVGGTWRENRYPGAACDVQSHMYSLSFAPKTDWSKRYAVAPEIFDYIQDITNQYQIKNYCKFNHEVTHVQYDEMRHVWSLDFANQ